MMIAVRFSHGGAICSGDYSNYYLDPMDKNTELYTKYFMISDGRFFKIYAYICFSLMGLLLSLLLCCATFGLMGEAMFTMSNIEH